MNRCIEPQTNALARERRGGPRSQRARAERRGTDRRQGARHVWMLNGAFDKITPAQALERVAAARADAPFRYVVTPNVDHLVRLERDPGFARLYARADLSVCDSRVLELLGALSDARVTATPGADLTALLFERAIQPDEPMVVIGADAGIIEALKSRYGLRDVRWHAPPMGLRRNPEAIAAAAAFVAANPCRFVFLCVGSPQQEMVAEACLDRGDCTGVGLCVGASLDFLTGRAHRAPRFVRAARLEWLYRLSQEPRRLWRRYMVEGPTVFVLWALWRWRRARISRLERILARRKH